jgi:hypothetical protein
MSNQLQVTGTALFSAAGQSIKLSSAFDVFLNITRGSSILNIGIDATGSFYNTSSNHRFLTNSGTINALTIASSGNVGINTSTFANAVFKLQVGNGSADTRTLLNPSNAFALALGNGASSLWYIGVNAQTASNGLQFYSNELSGVALTINTSGNVLIGTTTDAGYKLDVGSTGRFFNGDQGSARVIIQNTGSGGQAVNLIAGNPNVDQTGFSIAYGNTNFLRFNSSGDATFSKSVSIIDGNELNLGQGGSSNVPIDFYSSNFGSGYEGRIMGLNSDGNTHFYSRNNNASFTDIGYFNDSGMYITYYGSYSDIRLKDVIETNPNIDLDGIDVIKYTLKSNPTLVRYGYSAQQVQSVLPDLVTLNTRIDGNNEDATLMLNYNDLYVLKIAALEKKLTELSQEVAKLKGSNN